MNLYVCSRMDAYDILMWKLIEKLNRKGDKCINLIFPVKKILLF